MKIVKDPIEELSDWLSFAMSQEGPNLDAMALATADAKGVPDVRFVLLKRINKQGLEFFTNKASPKAQQIIKNPHAAGVLYWPGQCRQVRVRGSVKELPKKRVKEYFASRSRLSQLGAWSSKQSETLDEYATLLQRHGKMQAKFGENAVTLPDFWTGYCLQPLAIEFWSEGAARLHERVIYERSTLKKAWKPRRLFP